MVDYRKLEQERVNALWRRDAVTCIQKCNELGVELEEVPELCELAEAERIFNSRRNLEESVTESSKMSKRKRTKGLDFYVPTYAYELRGLIKEYCETNKRSLPKRFSSMKKKQLYAIYFSLME